MLKTWKKSAVIGMMIAVFFQGQALATDLPSLQSVHSSTNQKAAFCRSLFFNGKIVAEEPYDQMGRDYQNQFSSFVATSVATADNLRSLAVQAFQLRLSISEKYNSYFVYDTQVQNPWFLRWMGMGSRRTLGVALKGTPRGDSIIESIDPVLQLEKMYQESGGDKKSKLFASEVSGPIGSSIPLQWGRRKDQNFVMVHPKNEEVPLFLDYCEKQWRIAFNSSLPSWRRAQALARFEWHWFWANPFGRAGAITGDALSLIVQKQALREGWIQNVRDEFRNQDLIAMRSPLTDYLQLRLHEWGVFVPDSAAEN